jgi:hypothetical protein
MTTFALMLLALALASLAATLLRAALSFRSAPGELTRTPRRYPPHSLAARLDEELRRGA